MGLFRDFLTGTALAALAIAGSSAAKAVPAAGELEAARAHLARSTCMIATAEAPSGPAAAAVKAYEEAEPPLWDHLGSATHPVTTTNPEAQAYFDQGMRLSANFNHAEALRAFRKAQRLDPGCAMCFWGEAFALGPNINVPMDPAINAQAVEAAGKASALAAGASEKERDLIAALATRYADDPAADRAPLDAAFADAMAALAEKYPDDLDIAVLAAEAAMDTQPWDYWEPGGAEPKGRTDEARRLLERVLAANPDHAWGIHLYIHLVEASDHPERAEPYAERLAALMPGAGHIVHMPSHIYYRVGRYGDALDSNIAASAVDEAYIAETGAVGVYPLAYYSHNIHFVLVSAQLLGDRATVLEQADKLDAWLSNEVASALPIAQPVKAAPYFAWAQYGDPDTVLAMAEPPGAPEYVKAMWHYARGVAFAEKKDVAGARAEADAIDAILTSTDWSVHDAWGVPARQVLAVARNVVRARAAQAEDDRQGAIALLEAAAATEDAIPYMEPPFWYFPVRQSLGAALLAEGRAEEAKAAFQEALHHARGSAFALFGLKEAAKATGDAETAKEAEAGLAKAWRGDPGMLTLDRL